MMERKNKFSRKRRNIGKNMLSFILVVAMVISNVQPMGALSTVWAAEEETAVFDEAAEISEVVQSDDEQKTEKSEDSNNEDEQIEPEETDKNNESSEAVTTSASEGNSETDETEKVSETEEASETVKPSETEEASETVKPSETEEASETVKPSETEEVSETAETETEELTETETVTETETETETATELITEEAAETVTVKIHFKNVDNWDEVALHYWGGGLKGTDWPGIDITEKDQDGYYVIEILDVKRTEDLGLVYNNKNGSQTKDITIPASVFEDGDICEIWTWPSDYSTSPDSIPDPKPDSSTSPEIDKNTVTFRYENDSAETVLVAGNMNGWTTDPESENAFRMVKGEDGIFTYQTKLQRGNYEYKFVVVKEDGLDWFFDPNNSNEVNGNSAFSITSLLSPEIKDYSATFYYENDSAETVLVAGSMNGWASDASSASAAKMEKNSDGIFTYTFSSLDPGDYQYKFVVDGAWIQDPNNDLIADDGFGGKNSFFTIGEDTSKIYEYTIHYYNPAVAEPVVDGPDLWLWNGNASSSSGKAYLYTDMLEDEENGIQWLTAEIKVPYKKIGLRGRLTAGKATKQDSEWTYAITDGEAAEIWYVYGKGIYDKKPTFGKVEKVEATVRPDSINYAQNTVLTLTLNDGEVTGRIREAYVDASDLGMSSKLEIDLDLLEVTLSVKESVATGTYTLPITVVDFYNNTVETEVTINVTERSKDDDFDWDEAVIYFMVTDRFFDGNSGNNTANGADTYGENEGLYHGGDFAGVTAKLDYLKELGINTIWITPIVDNIAGVTVDDGTGDVPFNASYHGYWASDFTKLDPSLGTESEFRTLISEAHNKGIKIMVDVVLNHAGYGTEEYFNELIKDEDGNYVQMIRDESQQVSGSDQQASLSGLPDFLTENEEVRNQVVQWQVDWMKNYEIDYFRVDTVKHADSTTWSSFKNELTKVNPKFKMIGEYYGAGHSWNGGVLGSGQMDSVLDFNFNDYATDFVKGNISSVENNLKDRNKTLNNTYMTGQFLSSHDEEGFKQNLLNQSWSQDAADAAALVAATLQITAKGQPVIYYGEEIGQTGKNNYPYQTNRYDFNWTEANSQKNDENSVYSHYNALLKIRNQYTELFAKGDRQSVAMSNQDGYDIISRSYNGDTIYIGMNIKAEEQTITIPVNSNGVNAYEDLYSKTKDNTTQKYEIIDGKIEITIPAAKDGGTVILVPSDFSEGLVAPELTIIKGKQIDLPAQLVKVSADGQKTKVDVTYTMETVDGVLLDDANKTIKVEDTFEGNTITLTAEAEGEKIEFQSKVYVDNNEITLKIHYNREDGNYEGWNIWAWRTGAGGVLYPFEDEDGEKVATVKLEARANYEYNYLVRLNDWEYQTKDAKVDLSEILCGTVHVYIGEDGLNGERVLDDDVLIGAKILSADYDSETGHIIVTTGMPVDGNAKEAFKLTASGSEIELKNVKANDTVYELTAVEDLTTMEAKAKSYSVIFDGYEYSVRMPSAYSTDEFEAMYTYDGNDLGATWTSAKTTFKVWAPTADRVQVNLYASGTEGTDDRIDTLEMTKGDKGVWSAEKEGDLNGVYYTYSVTSGRNTKEACDPYAVTTGVNGNRAMVINLDSTDPEGWAQDHGSTDGMNYTDAVIYEMHVRDFSIDASSGIKNKGKFLGLTEKGTKNITGQTTGLDYLVDLGVTHLHLLPSYDYATVDETKLDTPQYNWGYDPKNYNVPEGSYSTDPYNGEVRVKEMKQMIKTLHDNDINVIMDVVYNHVFSAEDFCFNQIVPQYFSRTAEDGSYSNGSGCGNDTASERSMVKKYIVDSVNYWADEYHIDGFRFDLVGLIDTETINEVVSTVHEKHPNVIFYGEGWTMDTAVTKEGYTMTTQTNSAQTPGFAFFSDTMRDLLKGSVFDATSIGFISGQQGKEEDVAKSFRAVPGWTSDPTQIINYASCHDNYTLKDKLNVSRADATEEDRIKMNNLAAAIYMMSEGIPLIHAGEEILRTKVDEKGDIIHNSYNSSDFVNSIKWSDLGKADYRDVRDYYKGLIAFRKEHAALRLTSTSDIANNIKYYTIKDNAVMFVINGKDSIKDEASDGIIVIFNADTDAKEIDLYDEAYGVSNGDWYICIDDQSAGTEAIGYAKDGKVTVAPISAMVLVKDSSMIDDAKESLKSLIEECDKVEQGEYTDDSWSSFQEALAAAKEIAEKENASEDEIISAKNNLNDAYKGLSSSLGDIEQAKKTLNDLIAECEKLEKDNYTDESWDEFSKVLAAAKETAENSDASLDEITKAWSNLDGAKGRLVSIKEALANLIAECEKIEKGDYTDESWNKFQEALTAAKEVVAKEDASIDEIKSAGDSLREVCEELLEQDKKTLNDLIAECKKIEKGNYPDESWDRFQSAITAAEKVAAREDATIDDIKFARNSLLVSIKEALANLIAECEKIEKGNYTDESWIKFQDAITTAKEVVAKEDASIDEIKSAGDSLRDVCEELLKQDKKTLNDLIAECKKIEKGNYTDESWNRFQGAITAAEKVAAREDATIDDIKLAGNSLRNACEELLEQDRKELNDLIAECEKIEKDDYTDESWSKFQDAITVAKEVVAKENATMDEIKSAGNSLRDVYKELLEQNKKILNDLIAECKKIEKDDYTDESWNRFQDAITAAEEIVAKEDVTINEIKSAENSLKDARRGLQVSSAPSDDLLEQSKQALNELIIEYAKVENDNYTDETWDIFQQALKAARETADKSDVSVDEINSAKDNLINAYNGLRKAEEMREGIHVEWADGSGIIMDHITYTGTAIKPTVVVYDGSKLLKEKTDYTISYKNNVNAGKASVIVTGKGNYAETVEKDFTIDKVNISTISVANLSTAVAANNTKQIVPNPVVKYNGKNLKKDTDYTVAYKNPSTDGKTPGVYDVIIKGNGNFEGEKTILMTLADKKAQVLMSKVKIQKIPNQSYNNGERVEPPIKVTYNGNELKLGTDYEVTYSNNTEAGATASVTVRGIGNIYAGEKTATFKINGTPLKASAVSLENTTFVYTGTAIEPKVQVAGLNADEYSVTYQNNKNAGKATVIVTGRKGYTGTVKKTFKITAYDINSNQFAYDTGVKVSYAKGGSKLSSNDLNARFTVNGNTLYLEQGVDYTLSYKSNKAVGKNAKVTIKGKGNYKGTIKNVSFEIEQKDISTLQNNAAAADIFAKNAAKYNKVVPSITDIDGKALKNKKDFTVIGYSDENGNAISGTPGTGKVIKVTVKGQGNYTGEASASFKVIANNKNISKAVVKIKDQQYTGNAVELTKEDFTTITLKVDGQTRTLKQDDFEIVGYSNNIKKGTAKVTIHGLGEYGGTKTVKFKITAKKISK